jgi:L-cystine uptake protein TcyP (sodium:dicarboxylate symporter family)
MRAAKTQSSAASSPSPRISSSASSGVISLMAPRNWCMRFTSRKKQSTIVVVLFHDFAFDDAFFLGSYIIDEGADFLGRQKHVAVIAA